ncbi:MAG: hypothetical protein A2Z75_05915 [Chloroflexi bacterium RBG_13_50_10]|nr:MAG: hypothetical protein A2Z75_05915 [Chloroflexi bacterium RBG_13_50_10]
MKKISELIWELAIALIAFAGAFTLVSNFFPSVPAYVFGSFFLLAFLVMLTSFGWRFYEYLHPVVVITADMTINTCDEPKLDIKVGFFSHAKTNIKALVWVKFESQLDKQLKTIAKFHPLCRLKTIDGENIIPLEPNEYVEVSGNIPISLYEGYTKDDFEAIDFLDKVKLGWSAIGRRTSWVKMSCSYMFILPELAARYPTMVKERKHGKAAKKDSKA